MLMKEVKEVVDTVSVALANGQPEEAGNVVMQEVNHALLSMGVDEAMADKIDNFIILLFIIGIALLANLYPSWFHQFPYRDSGPYYEYSGIDRSRFSGRRQWKNGYCGWL